MTIDPLGKFRAFQSVVSMIAMVGVTRGGIQVAPTAR